MQEPTTLHRKYVEVQGEWYLLSWVAPRDKEHVDAQIGKIAVLRRASNCLREFSRSAYDEIDDQTCLFGRVVILSYIDMARSFDNSVMLLSIGSLADSLTLLRPVLEYLLDIVYLILHPEAVTQYEAKANKRNAMVAYRGSAPRSPRENMRFLNPKTMKDKIRKHEECTDIHLMMIDQYDLVSSVVEHTSPERKTLGLREVEHWSNVLGVLENVTFLTFHTLDAVEASISSSAFESEEYREMKSLLYSMFAYSP